MATYIIRTAGDYYYRINEQRQITRVKVHGNEYVVAPSDNWTCKGFREVRPFGRLSDELFSPEELVSRSNHGHTTFQNGKPKYRLEDVDHGTTRLWGDGIIAIWKDKYNKV